MLGGGREGGGGGLAGVHGNHFCRNHTAVKGSRLTEDVLMHKEQNHQMVFIIF
jgi:hypothetical protein